MECVVSLRKKAICHQVFSDGPVTRLEKVWDSYLRDRGKLGEHKGNKAPKILFLFIQWCSFVWKYI